MSAILSPAVCDAATLLSRWWSRPTESEVDAWVDAWPVARELAAEIGADPRTVDELARAQGQESVDELLNEYERLFVGPGRTPCPPYESLWRSEQAKLEQGRLMGAPSAAVVDLYRTLDLDVAAGAHELPDHVAVEWEATACALREDNAAVASALLEEHLGAWLPAFCAAVREHARLPFYATLADLTCTWAGALAADVAP